MGVTRNDSVRRLRELIAALDRRVPHVERAGVAAIARDAAMLKAKALKRLAELDGEQSATSSGSATSQKRTTLKSG